MVFAHIGRPALAEFKALRAVSHDFGRRATASEPHLTHAIAHRLSDEVFGRAPRCCIRGPHAPWESDVPAAPQHFGAWYRVLHPLRFRRQKKAKQQALAQANQRLQEKQHARAQLQARQHVALPHLYGFAQRAQYLFIDAAALVGFGSPSAGAAPSLHCVAKVALQLHQDGDDLALQRLNDALPLAPLHLIIASEHGKVDLDSFFLLTTLKIQPGPACHLELLHGQMFACLTILKLASVSLPSPEELPAVTLPQLKELHLAQNLLRYCDLALFPWEMFPFIKTLRITENLLDKERLDLLDLSALKHLRCLDLTDNALFPEDVAELGERLPPRLKQLGLASNDLLERLDRMPAWGVPVPDIRPHFFRGWPLTVETNRKRAAVARLTHTAKLRAETTPPHNRLMPLHNLRVLDYRFNSNALKNNHVAQLLNMPALRHLKLEGCARTLHVAQQMLRLAVTECRAWFAASIDSWAATDCQLHISRIDARWATLNVLCARPQGAKEAHLQVSLGMLLCTPADELDLQTFWQNLLAECAAAG